jgi:PadR family transcriptional regulator PadR
MLFQVGTPLLDSCVLSFLRKEDTYGYILTQTLKTTLEISESTLYPVLRRLQKDGCLSTYDQPFQGRNRRYYSITDKGRFQADFLKNAWLDYCRRINSIVLGGEQVG